MNKLNEEAKTWQGNVLVIGEINDQIITSLNKNQNVNTVNQLQKGIGATLPFQVKKERKKRVEIKKLKKKFSKKEVNVILCMEDAVLPYLRNFIKNSIYICSGDIYFYLKQSEDYETIIKRYKRYRLLTTMLQDDEYVFFKVEVGNAKNKRIKEKFYYMIDLISDLFDMITNFISM